MTAQPQYLCIDLKSFYASVACMDRGLNPLKTKLVVANKSRTDKTICLAVSPALKALGIPGRPVSSRCANGWKTFHGAPAKSFPLSLNRLR